MKNELITAFSDEPSVLKEDLVSLNMGVKKRTGEKFVKATTSDGRTIIKTLTKRGVQQDTLVKIPAYASKDERNAIVKELSQSYVQDDIADMLGISQGTVCNILKKQR